MRDPSKAPIQSAGEEAAGGLCLTIHAKTGDDMHGAKKLRDFFNYMSITCIYFLDWGEGW